MRGVRIKPIYLYGVILLLAFGLYGATGIKGAITPYVNIEQAKATADRVQVKGNLDKSSIRRDIETRAMEFELKEFKTGQQFKVIYTGEQPANMQMARDVVAMGKWDPVANVFRADQMNIKCPDKYQSAPR